MAEISNLLFIDYSYEEWGGMPQPLNPIPKCTLHKVIWVEPCYSIQSKLYNGRLFANEEYGILFNHFELPIILFMYV